MTNEELNMNLPNMSEQELRDLEQEAGRPLTQRQAHEFRMRRVKHQCMVQMLES